MILLSREQKYLLQCNEISTLSKPLQSRFRCLYLPRHGEEQFLEVSANVLPNLKIALVIGRAARDQRGDIRDVILRKLVRKNDSPEEVELILRTVAENNKEFRVHQSWSNRHTWFKTRFAECARCRKIDNDLL